MESEAQMRRLAAIWSLRAILLCGKLRTLDKNIRGWQEEILDLVGLDHLDTQDLSHQELVRESARRLDCLMREPLGEKGTLFRNLDELGSSIGLSAGEGTVLTFVLLLNEYEGLSGSIELLGEVGLSASYHRLSKVLEMDVGDIKNALRPDGPLVSSHLIKIDERPRQSIANRLEPLCGLCDRLQLADDMEAVLGIYFRKAPETSLGTADFPHLKDDIELLLRFLANSLQQWMEGVNILFYGPPGTGKTELARAVSGRLGCVLYEVTDEGEELRRRTSRMGSYRLCQRLLAKKQKCLVVFDEIEDAFPVEMSSLFGTSRSFGGEKAQINRTLERNPVPTIWITNSVDQMDPAYLRRFDMMLEVPVPPHAIRERILDRAVRGLRVNRNWLKQTALNSHLVPSHVEKAVRVTRTAGIEMGSRTEQALDRLIEQRYRVMEENHLIPKLSASLPSYYRSDFLQCDCELDKLLKGLTAHPHGRICLYGPSGTGKSALVRHLGDRLEKPVLVRRASDLLGPFVGMTERAIASMFRQAVKDNAILFLDEADSFLYDRVQASHSWERTQVNELLVQMEAFAGLLFCSTNLETVLDDAVFRRFDLKIKFDYIGSDQARGLFRAVLETEGAEIPPAAAARWMSELDGIERLTPAAFTTVLRKLRLLAATIDGEALLAGLRRETAVGTFGNRQKPGFRP